MAKIVTRKKKKKSFDLMRFAVVLFVCSSFLYLASTLFLHSYNNTLSAKKQEIDSQIATIQTQNDAVAVEIQKLSSTERVYGIAANSDMSLTQSNIVTISENDAVGE